MSRKYYFALDAFMADGAVPGPRGGGLLSFGVRLTDLYSFILILGLPLAQSSLLTSSKVNYY